MKIFSINCTNLKYDRTFKLDKLFLSEAKARSFIEKLDAIETKWDFDYEIVSEEIS